MTSIQSNQQHVISGQLLSSTKVKQAERDETLKQQQHLAHADGNNNLLLVREHGDDVIISNVSVSEDIELSQLNIGDTAILGNAFGKIAFIDSGNDDDVYRELNQ